MTRDAFWFAVITALAIAPCAADGPASIRVRVEFLVGGECAVSGAGQGYRANLTYTRPDATEGRAHRDALRCLVPGAPKGKPVELEVLLPPGISSAGGDFPRLAWHEESGRWVGRARLPSAPAFVRVQPTGTEGAWATRGLDLLALVVTTTALVWALAYGRSR